MNYSFFLNSNFWHALINDFFILIVLIVEINFLLFILSAFCLIVQCNLFLNCLLLNRNFCWLNYKVLGYLFFLYLFYLFFLLLNLNHITAFNLRLSAFYRLLIWNIRFLNILLVLANFAYVFDYLWRSHFLILGWLLCLRFRKRCSLGIW